MKFKTFAQVALLLMVGSTAFARHYREWTYEELTTEADLVAIGSVVSTNRFNEQFDKNLYNGAPMDAKLTVITVLSALKGKAKDKRIEIVHFQVSESHNEGISNPPDTPTFSKNALQIEIRAASANGLHQEQTLLKPKYMLFLKRRDDGKYRPVSGYVDSAFSVVLLKPESSLANWTE